jgi:hypothetical protein
MNNHEISLPLAPMLFHSPETRQGMNSLANSRSRLKPTKILIFSPMQEDFCYDTGNSFPVGLSNYRIIELSN